MRILFLAHRAPWPPDKGERIRAFHLLRHLASGHEVHLGAHVAPNERRAASFALKAYCASLCLRPLTATAQFRRFALALVRGHALSLHAFCDRILRAWVEERLQAGVDFIFLYSGAAAEVLPQPQAVPVIADLVDCDSAKWRDLADHTCDPLRRALLRREARLVRTVERRILELAKVTLVAAGREREELLALAPAAAHRIRVIGNGVDAQWFDPEQPFPCPYPADDRPVLVFTGAMNYPPNVEAALMVAREVLPRLEAAGRQVRFAVVGRHPVRALRQLHDGHRVLVTGYVSDIRPWLAHATLAVAPLAIARGVQNKLLEAMAMALPVIATPKAAAGIEVVDGEHVLLATGANETAAAIDWLLAHREEAQCLGWRARELVVRRYRWEDRFAELDAVLRSLPGE